MNASVAVVWIVICCVCGGSSLFAQQETESQDSQALFDSSIESGVFGGPLLSITSLNGKANLLSGVRVAWLINHRIALGGGYYTLISPHKIAAGGGKQMEMDMEYSAFTAEYIFSPQSLIHYTTQLSIGVGSVDFSTAGVVNSSTTEDFFFIVEPGVSAEMNLLPMLRLQAGVNYRIVSGVNNNSLGITNTNINGIGAHIMVKVGKF